MGVMKLAFVMLSDQFFLLSYMHSMDDFSLKYVNARGISLMLVIIEVLLYQWYIGFCGFMV